MKARIRHRLAGLGAIHVVTDVLGATAVLHGPMGRALKQCQTPCSFNNLIPSKYSLDVKKDGYRPIETALQVKANRRLGSKIESRIPGERALSEQRSAGRGRSYRWREAIGADAADAAARAGRVQADVAAPGYEPYSAKVQVKDNVQTELALKLNAKIKRPCSVGASGDDSEGRGNSWWTAHRRGKRAPRGWSCPIGLHTVTLRLDGFKEVRRTVEVSDGGTVTVAAWLKRQ